MRKGDATLFAQEHQSGHATAGWGKRVASPIIPSSDSVCIGNGSDEIIDLIIRAVAAPGRLSMNSPPMTPLSRRSTTSKLRFLGDGAGGV